VDRLSTLGTVGGEMLRRSVIGLAITGALAFGAPVTVAESAKPSPQVTISCTNATIGGKHKCLKRGQFCQRQYQHDYKKYGFSCSRRDRRGRYHLR
jgi:uncharacterized membrane protein